MPMFGKRVKIYYKGVSKLCLNCFGKHHRKSCDMAKIPWINDIKAFMTEYSNLPKKHLVDGTSSNSKVTNYREVFKMGM
jgi:hypothetical protein